MNRITLQNVIPEVFASGMTVQPHPGQSDVWERELTFERPGRYLVVAESGTGKSSLCSYLYGNRRDYRGTILFDGQDISRFTTGQWCSLRCDTLALLPQEMRIFGELTVMENIDIKNRLTHCKTRQQILDMLDMLEIADKADTPAALLSIGQQQRVAIVRTLCQPFSFILLDEPVSHLDARNNAVAARLIDDEARSRDAAIITTSVGNHLSLDSFSTLAL